MYLIFELKFRQNIHQQARRARLQSRTLWRFGSWSASRLGGATRSAAPGLPGGPHFFGFHALLQKLSTSYGEYCKAPSRQHKSLTCSTYKSLPVPVSKPTVVRLCLPKARGLPRGGAPGPGARASLRLPEPRRLPPGPPALAAARHRAGRS